MRRVQEPPRIARLRRDAHKGVCGRVLIVAGSRDMSGAARLAGWGALRGGAGLVTIAVPDIVQALVAAELPCAMTMPLPTRKGMFAATGAAAVRAAALAADAVVVGPGLTTAAAPLLRRLFKGIKDSDQPFETPLVLDADALNVLAKTPDLLMGHEGPRVLTPHPGEARRLLGEEFEGNLEGRVGAAAELTETHGATTVLKGAGTVVCDGARYYVNRTGNPGMATGGTGDILAGVIGARLASGASPFAAAVQAVHAHGRAGDLASASMGEHGMIATDVVVHLASAIAELVEPPPKRTPRAKKDKGKSNGGGSRRRRAN